MWPEAKNSQRAVNARCRAQDRIRDKGWRAVSARCRTQDRVRDKGWACVRDKGWVCSRDKGWDRIRDKGWDRPLIEISEGSDEGEVRIG